MGSNDELEEEIDTAIVALELSGSISKLASNEAEAITKLAKEKFVRENPRFWWTSFVGSVERQVPDGKGCRDISALLKDSIGNCYFLPDPNEAKSLVYFGAFSAFCDIIENCYYFEYYLTGVNQRWIACENHHDQIITCLQDR
ncbi:MAG: hypothetical protein P1V97_08880 [Planctomycetota bacterium]|nr:hypothetical protein [Planctomycetota bacterium]